MKKITVRGMVLANDCITKKGKSFPEIQRSIQQFLTQPERFLFILKDNKSHDTSFDIELVLGLKNSDQSFTINHNNNMAVIENSASTNIQIKGSILQTLSALLSRYKLRKHEIISFGVSEEHLQLNDIAELHFHLGRESVLRKKFRSIIPMSEQYDVGLRNILEYFSNRNYFDTPLDYKDMVEFIKNSISFYKKSTAAQEVLADHNKACLDLLNAFPNDIAGIFGTGYPHYMLNNDFCVFHEIKPEFIINTVDVAINDKTPASIFKYLEIQHEYFNNKILPEDIYFKNKERKFRASDMKSDFDLDVHRNEFDKYKYTKMNYPVPSTPDGENSLDDYYEHACFEIDGDVWPCFYCATLQFADLFHNQKVLKDTNKSCLLCKQTAFMLRNIMSCSTDIDIIVVVNKNKEYYAQKIKEFLINSKDYYIYDLDFYRTVKNENDGPIDIFITDKDNFLNSFPYLLRDNWTNAYFNSVALWSMALNNHKFNIGEDFPLAFEPRLINDNNLLLEFLKLRKQFAQIHDNVAITQKLKNYTPPREQMLSNREIVDKIHHRLDNWRKLSLT